MAEYSVKVNRREGALEVVGDKAWVDAKLSELSYVFERPVESDAQRTEGAAKAVRSSAQKGEGGSERRQTRSRRSSGASRVKGLDLVPKDKPSFSEFVSEKKPSSQHDRSTVSVYYLSEIANIAPVTSDHIYTCYRDQGWKMPPDLVASLRLTASKKGFFDTGNSDDIRLEPRGVNHVEHELPSSKS